MHIQVPITPGPKPPLNQGLHSRYVFTVARKLKNLGVFSEIFVSIFSLNYIKYLENHQSSCGFTIKVQQWIFLKMLKYMVILLQEWNQIIIISDRKIDNFHILILVTFERFFKLICLFEIPLLRLKIKIITLTQNMEEQMENNWTSDWIDHHIYYIWLQTG